MGDKFEFISKSHLTQFGLDINEVDDVAIRNIKNKFYAHNNIKEVDLSDDIPNAKPFYKVEIDANFPPSMMLVDDFWDNVIHQYIQTETVAVSLPSKSLFFFSDFQNIDSFHPMKTFGEYMYNVSVQDNIPITQNIYLRVNGKWTLLTDSF